MAKFGSWPEPENLMPKFDNGDDDDVGETEIQYLAMKFFGGNLELEFARPSQRRSVIIKQCDQYPIVIQIDRLPEIWNLAEYDWQNIQMK